MPRRKRESRRESEVAAWHRLSGQPDNVTDEGEVVDSERGSRLAGEKELLRGAVTSLGSADRPEEVRTLARLAASYLLAGDVETARRYLEQARTRLEGS
jgi:hypothetical protein